MSLRRLFPILAALVVGACGSSNSSNPSNPSLSKATSLSYVDPAAGGWRLVRNTKASTPTRLVLDLVGAPGSSTRGVGLNVAAPAELRFGRFDSTSTAVEDTGVYELRNIAAGVPAGTYEPTLLAAGVLPGNVLTAGVFQKDRAATAKDSSVPVLRIALELSETSTISTGTPLPVSVVKAMVVPADIGLLGNDLDIITKSHLKPIEITVGTVTAN
jgi:hypothetical protein